MAYLLVCSVALVASSLTFFSGFGLGTLLLPAFAFFFPVEAAVAATAAVHLANNLFKLAIVGRHADRRVLLRFALPAILAAFGGALLLTTLADTPPLASWRIDARTFDISAVKLAVASVMLAFAVVELAPSFDRLAFPPRLLPLGGAVSGFFGGLSGHQGALRSAFLIRCGLSKQAFIGTGVASACLVDVARLAVYASDPAGGHARAIVHADRWPLVVAACVAAFAGSLLGARLLHKVTIRALRVTVGVMLGVIALLLGAGII
ncbi:MAG: sulfite exporter TauE/SafE family protein [Planctomycetota bacterium]|nr:sulfite exporter TauE/SafE family protein [Planctomycetota bacterium]